VAASPAAALVAEVAAPFNRHKHDQ